MIISHYNVIVSRGRQLASGLCARPCTAYSWDLPAIWTVWNLYRMYEHATPATHRSISMTMPSPRALPPFPPLLRIYVPVPSMVSVRRVGPSDFALRDPMVRKMSGRVKRRISGAKHSFGIGLKESFYDGERVPRYRSRREYKLTIILSIIFLFAKWQLFYRHLLYVYVVLRILNTPSAFLSSLPHENITHVRVRT